MPPTKPSIELPARHCGVVGQKSSWLEAPATADCCDPCDCISSGCERPTVAEGDRSGRRLASPSCAGESCFFVSASRFASRERRSCSASIVPGFERPLWTSNLQARLRQLSALRPCVWEAILFQQVPSSM